MRSRVLLVSGHPDDARNLSHMLQNLPITMDNVGSLHQARTKLQQEDYNVVMTEAALPDGNWLDVLHLARESSHEFQVVVTDPHADARLWAEALNLGVYDLVAQPFYQPEVCRILYNACSRPEYGHHAMTAV
jgi:two-component system response regulator PilR (NtrC family)